MKEVCIVPSYYRPEFLYLCLKKIASCEEIDGLLVAVMMDYHSDRQHLDRSGELDVAKASEFESLNLRIHQATPHSYKGNSFNLLSSYREAMRNGFERIYLIEEDVMVAPDFFTWQRQALEQGNFFCAVASGYPASARAACRPVDSLIYGSQHYASIGVGWRQENLSKVLEHATPEYFSDMPGYCLRTFPENPDGCYTEQDGLIGRVIARENAEVAWAVKPKAFHIGYYGRNRGWKNPIAGTWREKAAKIEAMWHDRSSLRALNEHHADSVEAVPAGI